MFIRVRVFSLLALSLLGGGCSGTLPKELLRDGGGAKDSRLIVVMDSSKRDGVSAKVDLPATAGTPCYFGKCGANLLCVINTCRTKCSTSCGDKAPECTGDDGCHTQTSFSSACMPGLAELGESCESRHCKATMMCVSVSHQTSKCYKLCKYGCPAGTSCGEGSNGCKACF
jgi:hypothetical protein